MSEPLDLKELIVDANFAGARYLFYCLSFLEIAIWKSSNTFWVRFLCHNQDFRFFFLFWDLLELKRTIRKIYAGTILLCFALLVQFYQWDKCAMDVTKVSHFAKGPKCVSLSYEVCILIILTVNANFISLSQ